MLFLGIGVLLLVLKYLDVGIVAKWEWWQVLIPFGLAALWWAWSDWSGRTKRREMEYLQKRKKERVEQQRAALGGKRRR